MIHIKLQFKNYISKLIERSSIIITIIIEIASEILKIQIPGNGISDKLFWTAAPNGVYSVGLGYKKAVSLSLEGRNEASSSFYLTQWDWKAIWRLKTLPKIQHFIWRCLTRSVATNQELCRRKKAPTTLCPLCFKSDETIEHLFFHCPWTRCIWFGSNMGIKAFNLQVTNFVAWWLLVTDSSSKNESHEISHVSECSVIDTESVGVLS